jgi:hypothetical protein
MTKTIRAQLLKYVARVMVDVDMSPTPLKVIRKQACLRIKGSFGLSKDPGPKRCLNTLWKEESKKIKTL